MVLVNKMSENYLQVKNLSVEISGQKILEDISFQAKKGEVLVIIGPNGSGKTTLLKAIIGVLDYVKGEVLMNGKSIKSNLGKIAYVPQKFDFDRTTPINVYEFMALENCGREDHSSSHINLALKEVNMENKSKNKLGSLSGGEFQRVMIARALLHGKELLIFDEPASGIDFAGEETIYKLIADLSSKRQVTSLIVSHELNIVGRYADNVICLNKKLLCYGPPESAITSKNIQNLYGQGATLFKHHNH